MTKTIPNYHTIPKHVAIIMDGNGRWAKARFLPRLFGHYRGVEAVRKVVRACSDARVECLTLFAFSSENWKRPAAEVSGLLSLFSVTLDREAQTFVQNRIQLKFIGDRWALPQTLQDKIAEIENMTAQCDGMRLLIAANYGGRWDILQAVQTLTGKVANGELNLETLDERMFEAHLDMGSLPPPDLFIRTGGERRISNFLLWQLAYTELYFSDVMWPEFDEVCLYEAFANFERRQQRYSMTND